MTAQQQTKSILDLLKEMSNFNFGSAENHTTNTRLQPQEVKTKNNTSVKQVKNEHLLQ